MKKRRVILVEDEDWGEIRVESLRKCISAGDYLVGLHLNKKIKVGTKTIPEVKPDLKFKEMKEESKDIEKPTPIYTEEHRRKNPMEMCKVCGKALKFCSH